MLLVPKEKRAIVASKVQQGSRVSAVQPGQKDQLEIVVMMVYLVYLA